MRFVGLALAAVLVLSVPAGAQYRRATGVPGPQGPQGQTGATGAEGPPGAAGPGAEVHVLVGPHTCAAGANSGIDCQVDADCPSSTCTGTASLHFLDETSSSAGSPSRTTRVTEGDTVTWDWVVASPTHDVFGGLLCAGGDNAGGPCDADTRACVGGSNVNGNCTVDGDCPSSTCGYSGCWVCNGGSNDGTRCFTNGICSGGGTCTKSGTCTTALADSFDAGGAVGSPHTFSYTFTIPGTYPYVCGVHPGAPGVGMTGTVVVEPLVAGPSTPTTAGEVGWFSNTTGEKLGADPLFNFDPTTKRLALSDSGNNTMLADGSGFAPDIPGGGMNNVLVGHNAGGAIATAAGNVIVGSGAMPNMADADYNVVIGFNADADSVSPNGDVVIGHEAGLGTHGSGESNELAGSVLIGRSVGGSDGPGDIQNVIIGNDTLASLQSGGNTDAGQDNVVIGHRAASNAAKLQGAVILGRLAAYNANLGLTHDIVIGMQALENAPGGDSDIDNVAIGYRALRNEDGSEDGSVAIGTQALTAQTDGGQNTAVGDSALIGVVHGFDNTALGYGAGASVNGSKSENTLIGRNADTIGGGIDNATAVGAYAQANANYAMALGAFTVCDTANAVCLGDSHVTGPVKVGTTRQAVLCDLVGAPTCGTGCATVVTNSGNCVGAVTTSTLATSVTVNWSATRGQAPFCTCTDNSVASFCAVTSVSTSSVTFGLSAGLTGTINFHCLLGG